MNQVKRLFDDFGRFDLSEEERNRLRPLWHGPDGELFEKMRQQFNAVLLRRLRGCPKEEVDMVRGEIDGMEIFFELLNKTAKTDEELEQEARDAQRGAVKVSPAI